MVDYTTFELHLNYGCTMVPTLSSTPHEDCTAGSVAKHQSTRLAARGLIAESEAKLKRDEG